MSIFKVIYAGEEEDEEFSSYEAADEYGLYMQSCEREGAEILNLSKGNFSIARRIHLPKYLGTGDCYVSLSMYEPRIQNLLSIPKCVKIHFDGNCDEFCRPVTMKTEGFLGLE